MRYALYRKKERNNMNEKQEYQVECMNVQEKEKGNKFRRVKRTFSINLFKRNFYWPEEDRWIRLNVSADGLRLINKRGLNACLKDATAAGLIKTI